MKTLKYEEVWLWNYETYEEVIERLSHFIEEVYNKKYGAGYAPKILEKQGNPNFIHKGVNNWPRQNDLKKPYREIRLLESLSNSFLKNLI